jgi:hypothetical protein
LSEFHQYDIFHMHVLSALVLSPEKVNTVSDVRDWRQFCAIADAHHVLVRSGMAVKRIVGAQCDEFYRILQREETRIASLMQCLSLILRELDTAGVPVAVIKSLDHWPDFGSDIDLFTDAPENVVTPIMRGRFDAEVVVPTLGDRLANKVNYRIPGMSELVEVHYGRLGQTGEHIDLARRVLARRRVDAFNGAIVPVPAPEEILIIATLQRMYRHFYFRICDIVNAARIVESGDVDFDELRHASRSAGIWPGVATYLKLVSQYVEHYRGRSLCLPYRVTHAARFGLKKVYPHAGFLRVPLFPQAASLYTRQLAKSVRRDPAATLRLSLLPPLAAAAGAKYKITGSDKGVW